MEPSDFFGSYVKVKPRVLDVALLSRIHARFSDDVKRDESEKEEKRKKLADTKLARLEKIREALVHHLHDYGNCAIEATHDEYGRLCLPGKRIGEMKIFNIDEDLKPFVCAFATELPELPTHRLVIDVKRGSSPDEVVFTFCFMEKS
jgi:hypothetical protein